MKSIFLNRRSPLLNALPFRKKFNKRPGRLFEALLYTKHNTQLTFTCSKSTIKTLEKVVKYVPS